MRSVWTLQAAEIPHQREKNTPAEKTPVGMRLRRTKSNEGRPVGDVWLRRDMMTWQACSPTAAAQWYATAEAKPGDKGSEPLLANITI